MTFVVVLVLGCTDEADSTASADAQSARPAESAEPTETVTTADASTVPATETDAEANTESASPEPAEEPPLSRIDWSRDRPSGAFDRESIGRFLLTYVELGPLNARTAPSLDASVVTQLAAQDPVVVTGVTSFIETINGRTAPWVRIEYGDTAERLVDNSGFGWSAWVFAAYLSESPDVSAPITSAVPSSDDAFPRTVTLRFGDRSQRIHLAHDGGQPFGVFVRAPGATGFRYTETPGTYIWDRDTNRVRHMGYFGGVIEAEPSMFTNDLRYRIDGFGSGATGRVYTVSVHSTGRVLAQISGAGGLTFDGRTMEVSVTRKPQLNPNIPGTFQIQKIIARCLKDTSNLTSSNMDKVVTVRYAFDTGDFSFVDCTEQIRE